MPEIQGTHIEREIITFRTLNLHYTFIKLHLLWLFLCFITVIFLTRIQYFTCFARSGFILDIEATLTQGRSKVFFTLYSPVDCNILSLIEVPSRKER